MKNIIKTNIQLGDTDLSYFIREGGDRVVLFIHGLGCSKESFYEAFNGDIFPSSFTLIAPDLLGHGESSMLLDSMCELTDHANLIEEFVRNLQVKNLNIVAHSMGGAIAIILTKTLINIQSIFCLEGNLISEDCNISKRVASMEENKFVNGFFPMVPLQFRCRGLESDPEINPVAYYRSAKSLVQWSKGGELLKIYNNLKIKKAYIHGEKNADLSVLTYLKKSELIEISGSGHFMMYENPLETYTKIVARLQ